MKIEGYELVDKAPPKGQFYCYVLSDPSGVPFYVGKASHPRRVAVHSEASHKTTNQLKKAISNKFFSAGSKPVRQFILCEDEARAFAVETELILRFGRRIDGGLLANLTFGGEGPTGFKHSEEFKARISNRHKGNKYNLGRKVSPDLRTRMSEANRGSGNPFYGKTMSPELKAKLRAINLGNKHTEEHKAKIGAKSRGHITSPETRAKISAAKKGRMPYEITPEVRAKMAATMRGRPGYWRGKTMTVEHRAKIGAAGAGRPGYWTGKTMTDETRAKMSQSTKLWWEKKHNSENAK